MCCSSLFQSLALAINHNADGYVMIIGLNDPAILSYQVYSTPLKGGEKGLWTNGGESRPVTPACQTHYYWTLEKNLEDLLKNRDNWHQDCWLESY
uniref:Uncharacterized protein n=1 Tax=Ditylenchus dipsaci TaxID=166011 RepID=A0A915EMM7_9BILA